MAQRRNVQSFPRPPLVERTSRHLQIRWEGQLVADTKDAYWVLETHHPPTYYLPRGSVLVPLLETRRRTHCEWKGEATYRAVRNPLTGEVVSDRVWIYEHPRAGFEAIAGHVAFYAGPWDCFVDGELVEAQPGDFYGGWLTSDIDGIIKGGHGNRDPTVA